MRRKLLTAQDAFVGVREPQEAEERQDPEVIQESEEGQTATAEASEHGLPDAKGGPEEGKEGWGAGDDSGRRRKGARSGKQQAGEEAEEETPWAEKEQRLMMAVVKDLTGALRVIRQQMEAKGQPERLTLYLEPEVADELSALWREVREATQLKVGKSAIVGAAVRMVLKDPRLKAAAAIMAVREKMGERE